MAAVALALGSGMSALAQDSKGTPVVRGEVIVVQAPKFHGGYVTEKDGVLLNDAMRALDADRTTKNALLTIIANNGELTVIGTTTDVAQASRVVMKLKALPGATKVYAFMDSLSGDSGQ
jgi:hypothetical protein